MGKYLILMDAHAMDGVPASEMPAAAAAAHAVCRDAIAAGVFVAAGGLAEEPASVVSADGAVTDGTLPDALGGLAIVDVPTREEALAWAARFAAACRCAQEVRALGPDPELDAWLAAARVGP